MKIIIFVGSVCLLVLLIKHIARNRKHRHSYFIDSQFTDEKNMCSVSYEECKGCSVSMEALFVVVFIGILVIVPIVHFFTKMQS